MEEEEEEIAGSDYRQWDELIPDALGLIFKKLSLQDILTKVPRVCKAWRKAASGPYCWQDIDIDEWSTTRPPEQVDRMLRLLVTRSSGSLRKLYVSRVNNDDVLAFIAEHARSLQCLIMLRSEISDAVVEQVAGKLSAVTSLDLSHCWQIGTRALEAIGKNCKLLSSFSWNMHLMHPTGINGAVYKSSHAEEAHAIAQTMPQLKQLKIAYLRINDESVLEILSGCPMLKTLDIRGCWDVHLDHKFLKMKRPNLEVLGPQLIVGVNDFGEFNDSDFSDYSYMDYIDDESFDGMWDDEGSDDMYEYDWPPSP